MSINCCSHSISAGALNQSFQKFGLVTVMTPSVPSYWQSRTSAVAFSLSAEPKHTSYRLATTCLNAPQTNTEKKYRAMVHFAVVNWCVRRPHQHWYFGDPASPRVQSSGLNWQTPEDVRTRVAAHFLVNELFNIAPAMNSSWFRVKKCILLRIKYVTYCNASPTATGIPIARICISFTYFSRYLTSYHAIFCPQKSLLLI